MQEEQAFAKIVRILRNLELLEGHPNLHECQIPASTIIRLLSDRGFDGVLVCLNTVRGRRKHFNMASSQREFTLKPTVEILAVRDAFQEFANKLLDAPLVMLRADHADRRIVPIKGALRVGAALYQPLFGPVGFAVVVEDKHRLLHLSAIFLNVG